MTIILKQWFQLSPEYDGVVRYLKVEIDAPKIEKLMRDGWEVAGAVNPKDEKEIKE